MANMYIPGLTLAHPRYASGFASYRAFMTVLARPRPFIEVCVTPAIGMDQGIIVPSLRGAPPPRGVNN